MKIAVAGLGLIGGSMCLALKRAGYKVYGGNRSRGALDYALKNNIIDGEVKTYQDCDVVFVALPLEATINFILNTQFKDGAIVADICGVKKIIEDEVYAAHLPISYVGVHPMAGKEVSGIENACENLFDKASMVICHGIFTDKKALIAIKKLTVDMGFKRIVECSADVHDKKIAYTSQLAHIVSNCYVKDETIENCLGFTGGSFQDMTRIAGVDENMWTELYLYNSLNLTCNLQKLIDNLIEVNQAIKSGDAETLSSILRVGRERFCDSKSNSFSKQSDSFLDGEIKTTLLHE
jgi:prephenate dehydrogenase